jgi:lipoprotein NlpD
MPAWRWPTQGQIIGRFVAGDQTEQGINIAGTSGQPIVTSADGVVVYSGAGLVGYGELIIIKHSDEWLSAYAHNRRRLVGEGAKVKAGDTIAEMGRTGAPREMLHFEIRRNGKPVDPLLYLPRK